ncbi:MAG: tRNA (adenosine(37)-N6)-threonylcarbamoyltransferase complex dimerization subunit type 1 TsaB [Lysobacterales bacterium]|nr:MAG: tRNA (adenosine(37)-N6)-threonylcarbamoyltransferase complex dimerization subunit type 1 TsaB [Xanthomonadales bacterium]
MTRLLAIETSSEACSLALSVDGRVHESHEHAPLRHAELLLPAVERLLAAAGVALRDLDAIAFGRGPGSFTSLRIGIGVVQGLAWAAGLPVVPVSSLAAVAQDALGQAPDDARERALAASGRIRVAVDARMQEVFTAEFEPGPGGLVRPCGEEIVCAPSALLGAAPPAIAAGNGFARFAELEPLCRSAAACLPELGPRAAMILRLAEGWLATHAPLPAALAQPVYIRNDIAEKPVA